MSKDENNGLLSKVVRFVRNPTTTWGDLEGGDGDRESSYSKQMLKEMIERKRRNDFVRKREFDMLRKMRRSEVMAGNDPAARPSFFQSSMPSRPDDRASTLKKIDEIEAQMSMQWWKNKHGDAANRTGGFPVSAHVPPDGSGRPSTPLPDAAAYGRTEPLPLAPQAEEADARTEPAPMLSSVTPVPAAQRPVAPPAARAPVAAPAAAPAPQGPAAQETGTPSSFTASKLFAIDVEEFAHDPELEEAAIRFANGDDAGAEAGLLEVLGPQGPRVNHEETWLTLFDLYRATGAQARFDEAAIEFANRFGRSAPQWLSLPQEVARIQAAAPAAAPAATSATADWTCPSSMGTQTVAALQAALARAQQPWRLSWAKLATIEEAAIEPLTRLMTQWTTQPVQLRFIAGDNLERVIKNAAPSGERDANPGWWKLRMELLRVMHRPDEFELAALDYCVTYEVSPPSWESARCEYKPLQADGSYVAGHTIIGEAFRDSLSSGLTTGFSEMGGSQMSNVSSVELAGSIMGDATQALEQLESKLLGADLMVISCARLVRIDFSAAGTLLNWASARQAEGRQVQFIDVHRLVAAFFNVIGISEHARVIARRD